MAIEIKTRPKQSSTSPFLIIGVIICLLVIIGVVGSYIYFHLEINKTQKAIAEKEAKAREVNQEIAAREAELRPMKAKIEQYAKLIASHKSPLDIFSFLEDSCLPEVYFYNIVLNTEKRSADLSGHAENFGTLEQQIAYLRSQPEVAKLDINSVILDIDEEVDFKFNIIFNASLFIPQIEEEIIEETEL